MGRKESKVISIFRNLDKNSMPVGLRLKGELQNRTIIGALLTILSLLAALAFSSSTFSDWINLTNPKISVGTEFSAKGEGEQSSKASINFTDANFYMSVSFYNPNNNSTSFYFNDNNYSFVEYINQLNISCTTCSQENKKTRMNLCNEKDFDLISLKSMSKFKSERILGIFKKYSFCFPTGFNGTIEDLDGGIKTNNNGNSKGNRDIKNSSGADANLNVTEMSSLNSSKLIEDQEVLTPGNGFLQDSSLTIFIPFSRKNINQTNIKKNTQPQNTNTKFIVTNTLSISSSSIQNAPAPTPTPKPPEQNTPNGSNTLQQPKPSQNSVPKNPLPINSSTNTNLNPPPNQPPKGAQTSTGLNTNNNLPPQQPGGTGTKTATTAPTQPKPPATDTGSSNTGTTTQSQTQPKPSTSTTQSQTQPKPSTTQTSSSTGTSTTNNSLPTTPSQQPPPGPTSSTTTNTNTGKNTSSGTGSDTDERKRPNRKINFYQKTNRNIKNVENKKDDNSNSRQIKRNLQANSDQNPPSTINEDEIQSVEVNAAMLQIINQFRFPKILLMDKDYQINPNAKLKLNQPLIEYIYNLNVLDYRDRLTGNPISYDIFIQEAIVEVIQPKLLWTDTQTQRVLRVYKIEENTMDSNINSGATVSFKSVAEIPKITITFISFNDFLSVFGSFSTVFAMLSVILSDFYKEIVLNASIINSVFKFIENTEDDIKKFNLWDEYDYLRKKLKKNFNNNKNKNKGDIKCVFNNLLDKELNEACNNDNLEQNDKNEEDGFHSKKGINTKEKPDGFKNIEMQNLCIDETNRSHNRLNPISFNEKEPNNINDYLHDELKIKKIDKKRFTFGDNVEISNLSENPRASSSDLLLKINADIKNNLKDDREIKEIELHKNLKINQNFINENICFIEPKKGLLPTITSNSKEEEENLAKIEEKKTNEMEEKQSTEKKFIVNKNFKMHLFNKLIVNNQLDKVQKIYKIKKKVNNKKKISSLEYWFSDTFGCLNKCLNHDRHKITSEINDLILKNVEISKLIKNNFELDFIKKLLLTEKQNKIFKYQLRYVNFANYEESMQYLKALGSEKNSREYMKKNNKTGSNDFKKYFFQLELIILFLGIICYSVMIRK